MIKILRTTCFLAILLPLISYSQTYHIRNYTLVDGLSQSEVYDIHEDHTGRIWLATRGGGLNIFDGVEFIKVGMRDGLPSNSVFTIAQDSSKILWIGTDNGLCKYDGTNFKTIVWGDSLQPTVVGDILIDHKQRVWAASNKGIHVIIGDSIYNYSEKFNIDIDYVSFINLDRNRNIWIGAGNEIIKVRNWEPQFYNSSDGLGIRRMTDMAETSNGLKFFATYGEGLYLKVGESYKRMTGLPFTESIIHEVICDDQDILWLATQDNGVYSFDPIDTTIMHLTKKEGLANDHVEAILKDSWGNYWFGTGGGGLSKYYLSPFTRHSTNTGLKIPGNFIYSIAIDRQGAKWIGTSRRGVTRITDSSQTTYNATNGFVNHKTRVVFEDSAGNIWFAPEGRGLWRYDSTFTSFTRNNSPLPSNWAKAITADKKGRLWVSIAGYGITRLTPDTSAATGYTFKTFTKKDGLPKQTIYALHSDKNGRLWFGANNGGLGYIDREDNIQAFTIANGLADNNVKVIMEDQFGRLWAGGTHLTRISIYHDSIIFKPVRTVDGLASSNIYQISQDVYGDVWIGSEMGVDKITLNEAGDIQRIKHFGHAEGFLGIETTHNAVVADSLGRMWFGTIDGLMEYHPGASVENNIPPTTTITGISLFYEPLSITEYGDFVGPWGRLTQSITLDHDKNHLSFEFSGIDLVNPEAVLFSWKLEGFDNKWSPAIRKKDATYSNLPPGEYVFKVKAMNSDGKWNETPIESRKITILPPPPPPPPFWDTLWFKASGIGILSIIFFLLLFNRFQRIRQERERLRLEKDVIQLEQKALRLQMNPHFIFNVLNTIQGLIGKKDEKGARYLLAKFARLMRATLENSRNTVIPLEDEIEALKLYMTLEKFSNNDSFDFDIRIDSEIDPEITAIPPMLVQPFVENAIIHGLKDIDRKGKLSIDFSRENDYLKCQVEDNGRGRLKAEEIKAQKESYHKSTGLAVTQERLDILHGKKNVRSLRFVDKHEQDEASDGTLVILLVPYDEML